MPAVGVLIRVCDRVGNLLAVSAELQALTVELRVEVLWPVGEPSERPGLARELSSGSLAPRQILRPLVGLRLASGRVALGVSGKPVKHAALDQPAVSKDLPSLAQARPVPLMSGQSLDELALSSAVEVGEQLYVAEG